MDRDESYIPGTDFIFSQDVDDGKELLTDGDIVLVPQPTISPNDPLNWSKFRKYYHMIVVLMVTGLTAATSNAASAAQNSLVDELGLSWGVFNVGAGILFIGIGWWTLLSSPSVFLWGCRINYIVGMLLGIIGNAWYANVKRGSDAIWSQLFVGASESVAEAVAQLSLSQVFYQHQVSTALGLYVMATSVGTFLGPLIGGYAADNLGWQWVGYLGLICSGFMLVVVFFTLEETYFDRQHFEQRHKEQNIGQGISPITSQQKLDDEKERDGKAAKNRSPHDSAHSLEARVSSVPVGPAKSILQGVLSPRLTHEPKQNVGDKPRTIWQRLAIITPAVNLQGWGFKQYAHRLWLTLRVFTFPAVIYSGIQWGFQDAWLTYYITVEDDNWSEDPWNYSDAGVAIMNVPSLIGAVIGCIYASWVADEFVIFMAKRNNGIREAESRLYVMLLAGIISPLGMFLFGIGTERGWAWPVPYVGLGFIGFGWGCSGDLSMSYLVDCYPEMVLEGMVGVSLINNMLGMAFSFACDGWLDSGVQNTFIAIGVIDFFIITILTVVMLIWGKKFRIWTRGMYYRFIDARDSLSS